MSPKTGLTFGALRRANMARLPTFKNARGGPAHSEPDGSDWCLAQWCNAVCGELGELANLIKKVERGDMTLDQARVELGKECADVVTYLDILAGRIGVDLGEETIAKFNQVSERVKSPIFLREDGSGHVVRGGLNYCEACDRETPRDFCPICGHPFPEEQAAGRGEHSAVMAAAGTPAESGSGEHGDVLRAAGIPGY